jgi:DNA gyrase subunit A
MSTIGDAFVVEMAKEIHQVNIEDELKQSYLDYAMSVIVGRALPDVRDGLKPVHRRVLFAMSELGNEWNKPYKKSARVVGDVIGKYHPHGDTAVYDTIVRMAQPFSMRYMLVDGQGNFGSIDGDNAAAMRYTEVRMSKFAHALMLDLEKDTVNFEPNYDETEFAPTVLPTRIPNLLVNGASGIAVGMATNIPPHNLKEVVSACLALIEDSSLTTEELMEHIPGPDFPTGAVINGRAGIVEAYRTGKGRVRIRAVIDVETDATTNRATLLVKELPYQVNKARLIEKIAELVKDKKLEGISALRDESDKDGIRVVIELKRHEVPDVVINNLYSQTQLQSVFGINMVALMDGQPKTLNLKQVLECFIKHRRVIVNRRTHFELKKSKNRAHILEGWGVALANIDEMITLIKAAANPQVAKEHMMAKAWVSGSVVAMLERAGTVDTKPEGIDSKFGLAESGYYLSDEQAQAILELRLHRLTALEQDKISQEYQNILTEINRLMGILLDPMVLMAVVKEELIAVRDEFGDARRTEIITDQQELCHEDLITEEDMVVTLSNEGYAKAQPLSSYTAQRRGGRGKAAAKVKDEDFIDKLIVASTHDTILCFSSKGKVYWLKVYQLPLGSRTSRGKPAINILPLEVDERISAILPLREYEEGKFVCLATAMGTIKKVPLVDFSRPRSNGIIAVDLAENDKLIGAQITDGQRAIMLFTDAGKAIRFNEEAVRPMGRTARGVRGVRLQENQAVISLIVVEPESTILTATENGYGKRTETDAYPIKGRGGQGVIAIQTSERNGKVVGAVQVFEQDEIILISEGGTLVRTHTNGVPVVGRNTQGVKLINLAEDEKLVGLQRVAEIEGVADFESDSSSEETEQNSDENMVDDNNDENSL